MAHRTTPEERELIKVIAHMPFDEAKRQAWSGQIEATGLNEELAEEIHTAFSTHHEGEADPAARARLLPEVARLINRWRLTQQSSKFRK
ncbi:hypothetical protein LARV_01041 [Longilinea arvoryzae]|uniref:Uncharacterized protein n=1 Tax=Longilinea arvoryzae TaxID=360412 RepID=A0A0S7BGJ4_9CHLR|nr:hypothetical protein [Longilinea arvoryzae]GAP13288.1 hypothetical protein LARV_01041 [Longilinea arvoryzae]